MSEYRGGTNHNLKGREKPDKMLRHIHRVQYLRDRAEAIAKNLKLPKMLEVKGLLIVDAPQPMNFHMLDQLEDGESDLSKRFIESLGYERDLYVSLSGGVPISVETTINERIETSIRKAIHRSKLSAEGRMHSTNPTSPSSTHLSVACWAVRFASKLFHPRVYSPRQRLEKLPLKGRIHEVRSADLV
jgi:hypothetical protein